MSLKFTFIDVLIGVSPVSRKSNFGKTKQRFSIRIPKRPRNIVRQLPHPHRNCYEIAILLQHIKHFQEFICHLKSDNINDAINFDQENLPRGNLPILINADKAMADEDILNEVKQKIEVTDCKSVTLIFSKNRGKTTRWENVQNWCQSHGWRSSESKHFFGCEDEAIVIYDVVPVFEDLSRARNLIIIVQTAGRNRGGETEMALENAIQHNQKDYVCNIFPNANCPFDGTKFIDVFNLTK